VTAPATAPDYTYTPVYDEDGYDQRGIGRPRADGIIDVSEIIWNPDPNDPEIIAGNRPYVNPNILDSTQQHIADVYCGGKIPKYTDPTYDLFRSILSREGPRDALKTAQRAGRGDRIGTQTLLDLPKGEPPAQMVHPFMTPDGATILYSAGGIGKGWVSIWLARQLVRQGIPVMILDYEFHPNEWGRRSEAMGFTEAEMALVHYRAPFSAEWEAARGTLDAVQEFVKADCDRLNIGALVIDSYTTATSTGAELGGQAAAQEFFGALAFINRPALVIAHVKGDTEKFPARPFGTVFVHNLARETWAVAGSSEDDIEIPWDPNTSKYQPAVMRLELRQMKGNVGLKARPQFITFSFSGNGDVDVTVLAPDTTHLITKIVSVLNRKKTGQTVAQIVSILKAEGDDTNGKRVRETITRDHGRSVKPVQGSAPAEYTAA
jgi:hypothetical protein